MNSELCHCVIVSKKRDASIELKKYTSVMTTGQYREIVDSCRRHRYDDLIIFVDDQRYKQFWQHVNFKRPSGERKCFFGFFSVIITAVMVSPPQTLSVCLAKDRPRYDGRERNTNRDDTNALVSVHDATNTRKGGARDIMTSGRIMFAKLRRKTLRTARR